MVWELGSHDWRVLITSTDLRSRGQPCLEISRCSHFFLMGSSHLSQSFSGAAPIGAILDKSKKEIPSGKVLQFSYGKSVSSIIIAQMAMDTYLTIANCSFSNGHHHFKYPYPWIINYHICIIYIHIYIYPSNYHWYIIIYHITVTIMYSHVYLVCRWFPYIYIYYTHNIYIYLCTHDIYIYIYTIYIL